MTYRYTWFYRLPNYYSQTEFLSEFLSQRSGHAFVAEYAPHLKFCEELDQLLTTDEKGNVELQANLEKLCDPQLVQSVREYHQRVSTCLGVPVGLVSAGEFADWLELTNRLVLRKLQAGKT